MKSKYIIGLFLLILTACSAPLTDEQKNADAVYLKQVKEYTLNPDGSSTYHYYHKLLYNSYQAINRYYGETFVVYNPKYQTLKVNKSETKMADGKVVKSPDNAYNEVLPGPAADAPAYNHLREMVITHVGLERGAVVELDYVIQTQNGFMPYFFDRVNLCESSPVKDLEVIVKVPKGEKLNYNIINQPEGLNCKKSANDTQDIYKWESFNLGAYSHEPYQAEGYAAYPFLTFSTTDFETTFSFLKGNLTNTFVADDAAKKLITSPATGWDKVNLIRDYVAKNINTYGVIPVWTGYRFRSPEEVWQCNGGTEGEKAILLAAMLKLAGFNSQITLAGYNHFFNKEVGFPGAFDKIWVCVDINGEKRVLSATDDHTEVPGSRITANINDDIAQMAFEKKTLPEYKALFEAELSISNDAKLSGKAMLNSNRFDAHKSVLSGIPSSAFSFTTTSAKQDSIIQTIIFTNPNLAEKVDGYHILTLPKISQGITSIGATELPLNRSTTIELPSAYNEVYSFTFTIPAGIKAVSPLSNTVVENSLGSCSIEGIEKDGKVVITRKIKINQASIPAASYNDFRQIMMLWADKNLNRFVFKIE
ncbi:MAG TPA: hypothetical protein DIW31_00445 [Bacteroidales bacterium]|nr:hypothetical protein [Bacteroidales bacterium]